MLSHPQVPFTNKGQAAPPPPPLSESVLSIIHEICFRFFSDSTQHISAASLSSHAYVFVVWPDCFHVVGCTGGLGGGVAASSHFSVTTKTGSINPVYEPSVQAASGRGRGGRRLLLLAPPTINR